MSTSAHPRSLYRTSEFIGIVVCSIAFILQRRYPIAVRNEKPIVMQMLGGSLGIIITAFILSKVHSELALYEQPHAPGLPTNKLITSGPFHCSRNPTYASILFILHPGLALLLGNLWIIVLMPLSCIMFWYILIRDEEKYLHEKFGPEWKQYCQNTRRWI